MWEKGRNRGKASPAPVSPTGAGPTALRAARLMVSRASSHRWPAYAAARPSPGGAITTIARVSLCAPRGERCLHTEGEQDKGLLGVSQSRGVWVGVGVHEYVVWAFMKGGRRGEWTGKVSGHMLERLPVTSMSAQPQASQESSLNLCLL